MFRKGIQPVIVLKANGSERAEVSVQESVHFEAVIEVPPNTGGIVTAEWDYEGKADFPVKAAIRYLNEEGSQAVVDGTYAFSKPGTYFAVLRAASNRNSGSSDVYTQVPNLCRVRVVVK